MNSLRCSDPVPRTRMRAWRLRLALLLLLPAVGCTDSLGIGADCAAEMREVRRRHGPPDEVRRGSRSELWLYDSREEGRFYFEFSWSATGEACTVRGPVSFRLSPGPGASRRDRVALVSPGVPAIPFSSVVKEEYR